MDRRELMQALAGLPFVGAILPATAAAVPAEEIISLTATGDVGGARVFMCWTDDEGQDQRTELTQSDEYTWTAPAPATGPGMIHFEFNQTRAIVADDCTLTIGFKE